jgi:hypothetical protein
LTHNKAVRCARLFSRTYSEAAIVFRSYGLEDTDCMGRPLTEDSPYTVVLDSDFERCFNDISNDQREARMKAIVEV